MNIEWMAAEAEQTSRTAEEHELPQLRTISLTARDGAPLGMTMRAGGPTADDLPIADWSGEEERERRVYRGRSINMLRRYMRYSLDTGRLPSVLGREFFRAKVAARSVVTFEDRVIFVHDMGDVAEQTG